MYNFIDVNDASEVVVLPSEALKINGEYIENQITGYRTLNVSGREALSPDVYSYTTGIRDGSLLKSKQYPERIITVTYQLIADSNEAFREAYNKLAAILDVENAELIFNDEQDKYFTGTPCIIGSVAPGKNSVVGEFEILCTDPFKYSVLEYEVEPKTVDGETVFTVDYNGTYKAYPTLEADFYNEQEISEDGETETALTGAGDCGFIAFYDDAENIIQIGDPEEENGEDLAKSQTLVNQSFTKSTSWGTAAKKLWAVNAGKTSSDAVVQVGAPGLGLPMPVADPTQRYITAANFGSGSKWHGPSITRTIPADAAGEVGAANWTLTYTQKMHIGNGKNDTKQLGAFQVLLWNSAGNVIAGVNVYKGGNGKNASLRFYLNNSVKETISIDLSYHNKYFGSNRVANPKKKIKAIVTSKTSTIKKEGQTVTFNIGGIKKVYRDSALADMNVEKITFTFTQFGTRTPLSYNGVYGIKFVKHNCDTWRNVQNKFSANDIVVADCKAGEIYLNDLKAPELGALGNDWESFCLTPGANQIGVTWSEWVPDEYKPTVKMRYREVFL